VKTLLTEPIENPNRVSLVDLANNKTFSYIDLYKEVSETFEVFSKLVGIPFILLKADATAFTVFAEIAVLENKGAVLLHNFEDAAIVREIADRFGCNISIGPVGVFRSTQLTSVGSLEYDPTLTAPELGDTALLLGTSGSTGSSKQVRLSREAIRSNASSIAHTLGLRKDDRAITSLPLSYSFGLSVLHSHLYAGASVVLSNLSIGESEFWQQFIENGCTSFSGVPFSYQMLKQMRFNPQKYPLMRMMTQAGGKMAPDLLKYFSELAHNHGIQLRVMYGQTEATARMAIATNDEIMSDPATVGKAIPGGSFEILDHEGQEVSTGVEGEITYRGPNVMLGYAESFEDLALPNQLNGVLPTGDLGYLDDHGRLFVTGRLRRITKVFGIRVSLDDVEQMLSRHGEIVAVSGDDCIVIAVGPDVKATFEQIKEEVANSLCTNKRGVVVRGVTSLPRLPTGKPNYEEVKRVLNV
jgi:acyl-CoA synthetase (AMP-forming)/AMP-acid ligase II